MAAKSSVSDAYANKFYGTVVESAANTLTFAEIQTNVDVFSKIAWVLHRLEWYVPAATRGLVSANDDVISMALCSSNGLTSLALNLPGVVDLMELQDMTAGAPANFQLVTAPLIRDFTGMPGGGLIIAPRPLYIAVKGVSLATACTVSVRGYFTVRQLSAEEYIDLVDFYRIVQ